MSSATILRTLALALALPFAACRTAPASSGAADAALLASWMTGTFSNEAQAELPAGLEHLHLVMTPLPTERADGTWLLSETRFVDDGTRKRRLLRLTDVSGGVRIDRFEAPGLGESPLEALDEFDLDRARRMDERAVRLERIGDDEFLGETIGAGDEFLWGRSLREGWRIRPDGIEVALWVLDEDDAGVPSAPQLLVLDRSHGS